MVIAVGARPLPVAAAEPEARLVRMSDRPPAAMDVQVQQIGRRRKVQGFGAEVVERRPRVRRQGRGFGVIWTGSRRGMGPGRGAEPAGMPAGTAGGLRRNRPRRRRRMAPAKAQAVNLSDHRVAGHAQAPRDFACAVSLRPQRLQCLDAFFGPFHVILPFVR